MNRLIKVFWSLRKVLSAGVAELWNQRPRHMCYWPFVKLSTLTPFFHLFLAINSILDPRERKQEEVWQAGGGLPSENRPARRFKVIKYDYNKDKRADLSILLKGRTQAGHARLKSCTRPKFFLHIMFPYTCMICALFRCNMFSHALIMYQNTLVTFWDKTSKTMNHVNNGFKVSKCFVFHPPCLFFF